MAPFQFPVINEIKEANDAHKANLEKCIEEERDERLSQNTELLDKIDKEKRDRSSGLAELKHKLEDEQDELKKEVLAGMEIFFLCNHYKICILNLSLLRSP